MPRHSGEPRSQRREAKTPSTPKCLKTSELDLHKSVADFLDWMLLPPAMWTTFPAGWGKLGKAVAGKLKACGLKEGMPDILVFHDRRTIGIELKTGTKQSEAQAMMASKLKEAGVPVWVCKSIDEVYDILFNDYRIPMRPYFYGYPANVPAAEARRKAQLDARKAKAAQEAIEFVAPPVEVR